MPDLDHMESLVTPATRVLVIIDPNNPTGRCIRPATRRALLDLAERHGLAILADEVYGDLGYDGPVPPLGSLDPDAPIISFSSLSKAYLAPGWRTGWMAVGRTPRLNDALAAIKKLADGRLCSTVPMEYAVTDALTGDRSHQIAFRAALKERAQITTDRLNAIPGIACVAPAAAFYAMPRICAASRQDGRRLRARPAARDGRAVRLRLGLRHAARRRLPAHRLPRVARRAADGVRPDGGLHARLFWSPTAAPSDRPPPHRPHVISDREYNRRMVRTVLTVTAVALVLAVMWAASEALMIIYVSAIIAMGISPLVRLIERPRTKERARRVPRTFAILAIYGSVVGAVVLIALMVMPPLIEQAGDLWSRAPQAFIDFQRFLIRHGMMTRRVTIEEAVQNAPAGSGGNAVNTVLLAIYGLIGGIFGVVTILILSFYLLVEAQSLFEWITRVVPEGSRARVGTVARESVRKVSAWLGAQFILAAVMGTFAAVGLGLMGVPYFYVVALVAAVGETIPIVGPIIGGISAVTVALTVSPKLALTVGIYFLVLHQLEANVLVPKIMERRVGVSPVTVLVALLIGGALWGLIGAILAIPTAAILSVIVSEMTADAATT